MRYDSELDDEEVELYARHIRCSYSNHRSGKPKSHSTRRWSWLRSDMLHNDKVVCYDCNTPVPEYIQALVLLHEVK